MNKNNINFQVCRTKEGTIAELVCGVLLLMSLILSLILLIKVREAGIAMLIQTGVMGFGVILMLVLAYHPKTFNVPDDSPAELYVVTIRFLRYIAVLTALMTLGITLSAFLGFNPVAMMCALGIIFVILMCWYLYQSIKTKRNKHHE